MKGVTNFKIFIEELGFAIKGGSFRDGTMV